MNAGVFNSVAMFVDRIQITFVGKACTFLVNSGGM